VTRRTDGEVRFTRPNGVRLETAPATPPWREATGSRGVQDASPLAPTKARLVAAGIVVGPPDGLAPVVRRSIQRGVRIDVLRQDQEREMAVPLPCR
jgi:hypothetical protein